MSESGELVEWGELVDWGEWGELGAEGCGGMCSSETCERTPLVGDVAAYESLRCPPPPRLRSWSERVCCEACLSEYSVAMLRGKNICAVSQREADGARIWGMDVRRV